MRNDLKPQKYSFKGDVKEKILFFDTFSGMTINRFLSIDERKCMDIYVFFIN